MTSPFAYRVKAARIQQGATQEQVANAIGVSKQAISQYESGRKRPESSTLIALAKYFDKPAAYFLRPVQTPLDQVDFRKKASLSGKKLQAVKTSIQDRLEPYLELESILAMSQAFVNPLEGLLIEALDQVEEAVEQLLKAWDLGLNPIPNALEMLEDHGIKVVEMPLDPEFHGLSSWVNSTIPVIVLNEAQDLPRKRFTAFHELGHLLLSFPEDRDHKFIEKACNRFAGAMLLPAQVLRSEIGNSRSHISLSELVPIKEYHGISLAAIMYRGKDLGIFSPALMKRFWEKRSRDSDLKYEKEELYGSYRGEERAFRFDQLLAKAIAEELISLSKAASLSGRDLQELKQAYWLI